MRARTQPWGQNGAPGQLRPCWSLTSQNKVMAAPWQAGHGPQLVVRLRVLIPETRPVVWFGPSLRIPEPSWVRGCLCGAAGASPSQTRETEMPRGPSQASRQGREEADCLPVSRQTCTDDELVCEIAFDFGMSAFPRSSLETESVGKNALWEHSWQWISLKEGATWGP